ncbi:RIP metalloprotease RseP [Prosthecomicrobium sp. N25]|uniref:RIP metalloprotease RseP n=1 Tax=Prosthecomicrobium sp. N25 TaxID=3129254 RepID=UPI003077DDB6
MDLFGGLINALWTTVSYGVPFLFVLTIVVFVHELGHFQVARWCGVKVRAFSIGFGPELVGWYDRHGTRWRIAAIPLGGYVKFEGDESAASTPDRDRLAAMSEAERAVSFQGQSISKRAAIVAAGPLANFILATVIFTAVYASEGRQVLLPVVGEVTQGGVAAEAGILPGDRIEAINGTAIGSFSDIIRVVAGSAGEKLDVRIARDGKPMDIVLVPRMTALDTSLGVQRRGMLGIRASLDPAHRIQQTYSIPGALREGVAQNWMIVEQTMGFFGRLFTGREYLDQISGIGRIAQASGETAKLGFVALVVWLAYISTSIGLLNLLPIPVLDGGHLVFYAIEAVRGRPLSERAQDFGFRVGLALVLMLMLVANWNDVIHFATKLGWGA